MSEPHNPYATPQSNLTDGLKDEAYCEIKMFSIRGRIGRLRYFSNIMGMFYILMILWGIEFAIIFSAAHTPSGMSFNSRVAAVGIGIVWLITLGVGFFLSMQRWHDTNRSGWFAILYFIPILNFVMWLFLFLAPGSSTRNDFGAPPPPNDLKAKILGTFYILLFLSKFLSLLWTRRYF